LGNTGLILNLSVDKVAYWGLIGHPPIEACINGKILEPNRERTFQHAMFDYQRVWEIMPKWPYNNSNNIFSLYIYIVKYDHSARNIDI